MPQVSCLAPAYNGDICLEFACAGEKPPTLAMLGLARFFSLDPTWTGLRQVRQNWRDPGGLPRHIPSCLRCGTLARSESWERSNVDHLGREPQPSGSPLIGRHA